MNKKLKFIYELTEEEFKILIREEIVSAIDGKIQKQTVRDLMKMNEVADHFQVSLVTIHKWRRCHVLPPTIKKGGRVYFLRKQIMESFEKINNVDKI